MLKKYVFERKSSKLGKSVLAIAAFTGLTFTAQNQTMADPVDVDQPLFSGEAVTKSYEHNYSNPNDFVENKDYGTENGKFEKY